MTDDEFLAALGDKALMREVARKLDPAMSDAEFEVAWALSRLSNPENAP